MALADKLVSWWGLQEASGTRVDEHGSNDLGSNNSVGQGTGHVAANCATFNGSTQYLNIASNSSLNYNASNGTIEFSGWVKFNSLGTQVLIGKDNNDSGAGRDYLLFLSSGQLNFAFVGSDNATIIATSTDTITTGVWYWFWCATRDVGGGNWGAFINVDRGSFFSNVGTGSPNTSGTQFDLGRRAASGSELFLDGSLEQVSVWNDVLTTGDLDDLYNGGAGVTYADVNPTVLTANVASATSISTGACTISGTAATGGTGPYDYQLQRGTDNATFGTNVGSQQVNVAGAPTPQGDTGRTDGLEYYYRWQIVDAASATVNSAGISVTTHTAGRTQYVATGGSDTNVGSSGSPWLTIDRANRYLERSVLAGDSLSFNGGNTFSGNIRVKLGAISNPPTSGSPFTLNSYGSGQATISAGNSYAIWGDEVEYVTIDNLTLTGSGVASDGSTTNTENGILCSLAGASDLSGLTVTNCIISGFRIAGIYFKVLTAATGKIQSPVITDNTVFQCAGGGIVTQRDNSALTSLVIVNALTARNEVYECYGDGVSNSGYGIILANGDGGVIHSNYIHECGQAAAGAAGGPAAIITVETDGAIIRNNECQQWTGEARDGFGIDCDGGSRNCIVEWNYIHDCDGPALVNFSIGGFTTNDNNTYRFNICQNNGRRSHTAGVDNPCTGPLTVQGSPNGNWYNNVFFDQNATGAETKTIHFNAATSGTEMYDNIFITNGSGRTFGTVVSGTTMNNNRYYAYNSSTFSITYNASTYTSLAAFQSGASQEASGTTGNPDLEDIGNAGTDYPFGDFSTLTEYDPTTSAIWDGGSNIQSYSGLDFHGRTVPRPGTGDYPLGSSGQIPVPGGANYYYRLLAGAC